MLKNYFTIALRTLRKHPGYTAINVVGLAVGIACCLLIGLYVQGELSYDRHHEHAERIYRVALDRVYPANTLGWASVGPGVAAGLQQELPAVEAVARFSKAAEVVRHGDESFNEEHILHVDPAFFDVFTVPVLRGDPAPALDDPGTVVLTASSARKYFGAADPMGQTLVFGDTLTLTVAGVVADPPPTSHFVYDLLRPIDDSGMGDRWDTAFFFYTYVLLREDASAAALEAKLPAVTRKYLGATFETEAGYDAWLNAGNAYRFFLQPLPSIHLHSDLEWEAQPNSDITYVYLFSAIALLILLLASVNFMNLATARATTRAREVGVRKVVGSSRGLLILQFLLEAVLMSLMALALALVLVALLLPGFNQVTGLELSAASLSTPHVLAGLILATIGLGMLAGSYPAFVLSAFRPMTMLKGTARGGVRHGGLRHSLVVAQFTISIALIACTGVVYNQMRFMLTKQLGFDDEQVVILEHTPALDPQTEAFRQEVLRHPGVQRFSYAAGVPGRLDGASSYRPADAPEEIVVNMRIAGVDGAYLETLDLGLAHGRAFRTSDYGDGPVEHVLINETAAHQLGWGDAAVGKQLLTTSDHLLTVIGVVADFHFESLRQEIRPLMLLPVHQWHSVAAIRVAGEDLSETLAFLQATWEAFVPHRPFAYTFLDTAFGALYEAERTTGRLFLTFTLLALLIACLGLFGLAAFTAEQRTKEIGIRKVLGASVRGIVVLLTRHFAVLVLAAALIAAPVAWFAMDRWLAAFAYRIDLHPWFFVAAAALALLIALATVSYQAFKAARINPTDALRYE